MTQAETGQRSHQPRTRMLATPGAGGGPAQIRLGTRRREGPALQPLIPELWPPGCERIKSVGCGPQFVVTCCSCPR